MIAVDTNVLVYAHRAEMPLHARAAEGVAGLAEGRAAWAIPWPCIHEFLAVVTHPRIFDPPTPLQAAIDQVEAWMESPTLALLGETAGHWPVLRELVSAADVAGPRVHDARIAAVPLPRRQPPVERRPGLQQVPHPHHHQRLPLTGAAAAVPRSPCPQRDVWTVRRRCGGDLVALGGAHTP